MNGVVKYVGVCLLLFLGEFAFGQSEQIHYNVSGILTDSLGMPVPDANIIFGRNGVKGTYYASSDAKGHFVIKLPSGNYSVGITHLSYKDLLGEIAIKSDTLLPYRLTASSNKLSEVKVYGDFIKYKGTGFTAKVRGNPLAENRSVLSFMNELPGIVGTSVNGRVAMVYINGREMKMGGDELLKFLSGIPTESIEELSARTHKSASVRASDAPAAIYITLRKTTDPRYSGQIMFYSRCKLSEKNYPAGNLNGSFGFFNKKFASLTSFSFSKIKEKMVDDHIIEGKAETSEMVRSDYPLIFDQSLFYDIDTNHSVGFGANIVYKADEKSRTRYYGDMVNPFSKDISQAMFTNDIYLNYKYTFAQKKACLDIKSDVLFDKYKYSEDYDGLSVDKVSSYTDKFFNYGFRANLNLKLSEESEFNIGADYVEAGSKRNYGAVTDGSINKFDFNENMLATYAEFYTSISVLELNAGVRYEHTFSKMTDIYSPNKFTREWQNGLYPTIALSYNDKKYRASLTLDRSGGRSGMQNYAPFLSIEGESMISVSGSSFISPSYITVVSLSQTFVNNHLFRIAYSNSKNDWNRMFVKEGDNLISSYINKGKEESCSASYTTRIKINKNRVFARLRLFGRYSKISAGDMSEGYASASVSTALTFKLPKDLTIVLRGHYMTPYNTFTYRMSESWGGDFEVEKKLAKNWSLEVYSNNIINSGKSKNKAVSSGVDYMFCSPPRPSLSFIITYKFNNFKGKRASGIGEVSSMGSGK